MEGEPPAEDLLEREPMEETLAAEAAWGSSAARWL